MLQAVGPGTISFSHDTAGEMVAVPLLAGGAVDVREHQLVAGTLGVGYDWYETGIWFTTSGQGRATEAAGTGPAEDGSRPGRPGRWRRRRQWPRRDRVALSGGPVHGPLRCRRTPRASCWCRSAATPSSATWRRASRSWSSRPPCCSRTRRSACSCTWSFPPPECSSGEHGVTATSGFGCYGPGRIGLQSSYDRLEDPGTDFRDSCQFSQHAW